MSETPEEEVLSKIQYLLIANNPSQAIRVIEQYGAFMQEKLYTESEIRSLIIKFWEQFPDKWDIEAWINENKKK